jgi:hypothetical protein
MFIKLGKNPDLAIKRLVMGGVSFDGPVEVEDDGVLLGGPIQVENPEVTTTDIVAPVVITLRKHALLVSPNPAIGEILGYQPAFPVTLSAGYFGELELKCGQVTDQQKEELQALPWLAKLHFILVSSAGD